MILSRQARVGLYIVFIVLAALAFFAVRAWEGRFGTYTLGAGVALFVIARLLRLWLLKKSPADTASENAAGVTKSSREKR